MELIVHVYIFHVQMILIEEEEEYYQNMKIINNN